MKLPHTEVKFYPEVKSETGLSSLWVSCKRTLRDEITSMYLSQKVINNVQSHYQTNIMELTLLLNVMMVLV